MTVAMAHQRLPRLPSVDGAPSRARFQPVPATAGVARQLLELQRTAGNRVATAQATRVQAKLLVGSVADPAERQADEVAREVMRHITAGGTSAAAGPEVDEDGPGLRRAVSEFASAAIGPEGGETSPELSASIQSERGRGESLAPAVRQPFERAFGADLSNVRVHSDDRSAELNRAVSARAFTTGSDIFFGAGQYRPESRAGQELLAHELTHTIQQG